MTPKTKGLYCRLLESRTSNFLPPEYFGLTSNRLIRQKPALRETCSGQQRELP